MAKKALITGITGQDGSYLAHFLLRKGYEVHGICRRASSPNTGRIDDLALENFTLHYGDVTDPLAMMRIIKMVMPDELYNLAAQSHVAVSFQLPEYTSQVNGIGVLNILEALRILDLGDTKFYQASSSELFGKVQTMPQNELTPFYPRSPYAVAKLYAHWIVVNYRESYNMFAANGILFNHESPVRGETFVTRKIAKAVARIVQGTQKTLYLGNLDAERDWGYAGDYVQAMWMILQQPVADDFVIATGKLHSVREFAHEAFSCVGIPIVWQGNGLREQGINSLNGEVVVAVDPTFFRPAEVDCLLGDATKARNKLGWAPTVDFNRLVHFMVQQELRVAPIVTPFSSTRGERMLSL